MKHFCLPKVKMKGTKDVLTFSYANILFQLQVNRQFPYNTPDMFIRAFYKSNFIPDVFFHRLYY